MGQPGDLRVNITISEPDGTTTKLNSPGPEMTEPPGPSSSTPCAVAPAAGDWVVLAGSLPPGTPDEWYAELVAALAGTGARVAVDTSDAPLRALVERLDVAAPHLMKPNGHELASFTGLDGDALEDDPVAAARAGRDAGRPRRRDACSPRSARDGAVLVDRRRRLARHPPADHGRQHRRRGRLQPLRLPARGHRGPCP